MDLSEYQTSGPEDRGFVESVTRSLKRDLPLDYIEFLCSSGGGEGVFGQDYLVVFPGAELLKMNAEYEVEKYAPGLFLFGSNGGGEGFAFDLTDAARPVVMMPFVGMDRKYAKHVAASFTELVDRMESGDDLFS